jgi:hypothetical protein
MTEDDNRAWHQERIAEARIERERRKRERQDRHATLHGHREALQWRLAAFDAVRAGIPAYLAALDDPDQHAPKWGMKLLSWFGDEEPEHATAVRALRRMLDTGGQQGSALRGVHVCAGIAGRPGDTDLIARLRQLQNYPSPPVWAAAAMARCGSILMSTAAWCRPFATACSKTRTNGLVPVPGRRHDRDGRREPRPSGAGGRR